MSTNTPPASPPAPARDPDDYVRPTSTVWTKACWPAGAAFPPYAFAMARLCARAGFAALGGAYQFLAEHPEAVIQPGERHDERDKNAGPRFRPTLGDVARPGRPSGTRGRDRR